MSGRQAGRPHWWGREWPLALALKWALRSLVGCPLPVVFQSARGSTWGVAYRLARSWPSAAGCWMATGLQWAAPGLVVPRPFLCELVKQPASTSQWPSALLCGMRWAALRFL